MSRFVGTAVPRFVDDWQSFRVTSDAAADVNRGLEAAGVRVPPSGRLNEYIRQLSLAESRNVGTSQPEYDWQRLHRAVADVGELQLIIDHLSRPPEVSGWQSKAYLAMKGSARPAEDLNNSAAWDHQFELFMAALCRRGGLDIELSEPDIVVRWPQRTLGIAAKRARSLSNLSKLVARANAQIEKSQHHGVIALDISYLASPDDMYFVAGGEPRDQPYVRRLVDSFLDDHHARMLKQVNRERTLGVIVYACALAVDYSALRLTVARGSVFGNFCSLRDPRLALFNDLRSAISVFV
jgi:hypothetical protein